MYPQKFAIQSHTVQKLIGAILIAVLLFVILPSYIVRKNSQYSWNLMFKQRQYTLDKREVNLPTHPVIFETESFISAMGDIPENTVSTVNQLLDDSPELTQTFQEIRFRSGVDLFYLLYLMEEYELEEVLLRQWKASVQAETSQNQIPETRQRYNLGDYDYEVSRRAYMDMMRSLLSIIEYKINHQQFDEAIILIGRLRNSLQILDPSPFDYLSAQYTFNKVLLLDIIYQNARLVRKYPEQYKQLSNTLLYNVYQIEGMDSTALSHPELGYLYAYAQGLSHFYRKQYIPAIDAFQEAEETTLNTPLHELSKLMQVRVYDQLADRSQSIDSLTMWKNEMSRILQRTDYYNYKNDVEFYQREIQEVINQLSMGTPGIVPPSPTYPRKDTPQIPSDSPLTRQELIRILQAILTILEDEQKR